MHACRRQHHHRRGAPRKRLRAVAPRITLTPLRRSAHARHGTCRRRTVQAPLPAGGHREFGKTPGRQLQRPLQPAAHGAQSRSPTKSPSRAPKAKKAGKRSARSSARRCPPKGWPANTAAPTISGSPAPKRENSASARRSPSRRATWTNSPTQFTYQWLRCEGYGEAGATEELGTECEPITVGKGLATHETYEVQAQDVARTIAAKVEAQNASGPAWRCRTPELILAAGEESEPPYPTLIAAAHDHRRGRRRAHADGPHGGMGKLADGFEDKWFRCKGATEEGIGATCGAITVKNGKGENEPVTGETYVTERRRRRLLDRGAGARRKPRRL